MIILLSPAKTLDYESAIPSLDVTQPVFLSQAKQLIGSLRKLSEKQIAALMELSPKLAKLNHDRYHAFSTPFTPSNARPAIFAFKGDVYEGLAVEQFSKADLAFAQKHLRILSGLYGLLKPLDLMQPYRLEMGCGFAHGNTKDLYQFWGDSITEQLNSELKTFPAKERFVVNLASEEYAKAVNPKKIDAPWISPVFKEQKGKDYKIVSFFAKKARGMMAHHLIQHRIKEVFKINSFSEDRYRFTPALSDDLRPTFTRAA